MATVCDAPADASLAAAPLTNRTALAQVACCVGCCCGRTDRGFPADDAAIVMVTELACHEPGCPPVETVIALFGGPSPRTWKIPRDAADLTAADVAAALAREPNPVGHGHPPQAGCCLPPAAPRPNPSGSSPAQAPRGDLP